MKIIIFGHQNWGIKGIETISKMNHEILHVFTHPLDMDKHENVWYNSLTEICSKLSIPVSEITKISEKEVNLIKQHSPDLILSLGYRRLIPKIIFNLPKFGTVNIHDGLLPKYRGFAPINWAIINGENEAGISAHYIDDNIDTGNIILQTKVSISNTDTAKIVYDKLIQAYPDFLLKLIPKIQNQDLQNLKQEKSDGFVCSRRFPNDGKINWIANRHTIYNLIRALSDPYPNSFFFHEEKKIFVKKAKLTIDDFRGLPGRICAKYTSGIIVTCGTDTKENQGLLITQIEVDGKNIAPADYFNKLWIDLQ